MLVDMHVTVSEMAACSIAFNLSCTCHAGTFNAVELEDLETASHYVKYAVASYAIQPVSENADKRSVILHTFVHNQLQAVQIEVLSQPF